METPLQKFVVYVAVPLIFLFVLEWVPKLLRSKRLSLLSKRFGLSFDSNSGNWKWLFEEKESYTRNALKGNIGSHSVEVFDSFQNDGTSRWRSLKRRTVLIIDGERREGGSMTGFMTVSMIKKRLEAIENGNLNL